MWTQKYRPNNLKEFISQSDAVRIFLEWMKRPGKGNALLLYGPPGVGKSALVEAYAKENNIDLIQMNASDHRSAKEIKEVIGKSTKQQTLFKKGKIFFIDEIDGLFGKEDAGGAAEIISIIKESKYPIVLSANNPYHPKLKSLRSYCELVKFGKVPVWDIEKKMRQICEHENIAYDDGVLRQLSRIAGGDLRSAINDLEMLAHAKKKIAISDLEELGSREREGNIFDALKIIFKTKSALAAKLALNNIDKSPEDVFWWLENNIANEYESPEELARAFDALSKADIFSRRIKYRQNWRLKSYMIDMMTAGVATAKKEMYRKFVNYQYPNNIIILGQNKPTKKAVYELRLKFAGYFHCSSKKFRSQILPYLKIMLKRKKIKEEFLSESKITSDDLKLLLA